MSGWSNKPAAVAMQELRRSSAAQPHRNKKAYSRKVKHKKVRGEWA